MSIARAWQESAPGRVFGAFRRAAMESALRRLIFGTEAYARQETVRASLFARALSALAGPASRTLERAGAAVRRGLPESVLLGWATPSRQGALPRALSGSAAFRALAGLRVESLLWLVFSYIVVDYALRTVPGFGLLASWWDELLIVLIVAAWPLQMALRGRVSWRVTPMDIPILLYLTAAAFLFFARSPATSIGVEGVRVYVEYMLWFFAASNLLLNKGQVRALVNWLIILGTLVGLHGIYQYIIGVPIPPLWIDASEATVKTRVYSIVGSPNVLGSFMVLVIPVTLSQVLAARSRLLRYAYFASLAPMAATLVFTYSRGAWLAMVCGFAVYGVIYNWRLLFALALAVYTAPKLVPGIASRIGYLLSPAYLISSARAGRVARWSKAVEVWRNHPLTGEGFGRYGGAVAARNIPGSNYVDNFYLKTLAESGIIGLAALVLLFLAGLRCALNAYSRLTDPALKSLAGGIIAGLCGVLIHNAVENIFEVPMMTTYFWLLLGTVAALPHLED
ncbi:MAG: O-antigen ligase family protein [Firmicutes bacterium]|nr:O-antigen ligase family protein [Bacillota bacterium]